METDWELHIQSSDNFVRGFFLCFSQESVYGILRENAKDRRLMGIKMKHLIDKLGREKALTKTEWITLLNGRTPDLAEYLFAKARDIRHQHYGRDIYIRGLIEFTNYCRNNCYYCGIRRGNEGLKRYRLTEEEILSCCEQGYALGFRTFVLQGGEDLYFTQEKSFIRKIAEMFMAFRLENTYTKDEILELYVNSIYFGDGYYCIYDASQGYFGKAPIDMTDYECTLLAGIPNAPSVYSLTANPELAEQRQEYVVQRMVQYGYISEDEAQSILQDQS